MKKYKYRSLTEKIIKGYYEVYNELGTGFLESVYESALKHVLRGYGLDVKSQYGVNVYFRQKLVGKFRADLMNFGDEPEFKRYIFDK